MSFLDKSILVNEVDYLRPAIDYGEARKFYEKFMVVSALSDFSPSIFSIRLWARCRIANFSNPYKFSIF